MPSSPCVELVRVSVRYGSVVALQDVSLVVEPGAVVCVRGANGAGKTSLLRALAGVLRPASGLRRGSPSVAYVPAAMTPPQLSAQRWLRGVRSRRVEDPAPVLERLAFAGDLTRSCRALSFGNLRKLLLADALTSSADLVVIDEAHLGLDADGHHGLATLVAERGAHGAAIVASVQQGDVLTGAHETFVVRDRGVGTVEPGTVDVTLNGPVAQLDALLRAARPLGFERDDGR